MDDRLTRVSSMDDHDRYRQLLREEEEISKRLFARLREIDGEKNGIMRRQTPCMACGRKNFEESMLVLDAADVEYLTAEHLDVGDRVCILGCD